MCLREAGGKLIEVWFAVSLAEGPGDINLAELPPPCPQTIYTQQQKRQAHGIQFMTHEDRIWI